MICYANLMNISRGTQRRATAALLPLLRLRAALGLSSPAFALAVALPVFLLVMAPLSLHDLSPSEAAEIFGSALFFGASMAIVAGFSRPIFEGARSDLSVLRAVLPCSEDDMELLRRASCRIEKAVLWRETVIGAAAALGHSFLLGHFAQAGAFVLSQTLATVLLWVLMFWTVPTMLRNARLFSSLGRVAEPDLLLPSRQAAFGAAALRPALFLIGLLCAYPLLLIFGENVPSGATTIGMGVSLLSLLLVITLPLLGIRRQITRKRVQLLADLDRRLDGIGGEQSLAGLSAQTLTEIDTLLDLRQRIVSAPGWPLDLAGVRRIVLYIILPPLTWTAAALVERLVDSAF